jgi:hypothetical protein
MEPANALAKLCQTLTFDTLLGHNRKDIAKRFPVRCSQVLQRKVQFNTCTTNKTSSIFVYDIIVRTMCNG